MNEQQSQKELNKASQNEDVAHIKYLLQRNVGANSTRNKESAISQWEDQKNISLQKKRRNFFSIFQDKTERYCAVKKQKLSTENIKRFSHKIMPPKTINIKLKFPSYLSDSQYLSNNSMNILPSIPKRVLLPLNYIRSLQKRKEQKDLSQQLFWPKIQDKKFKKGKLLHLPQHKKILQSPKSALNQHIDLRSCFSKQNFFHS